MHLRPLRSMGTRHISCLLLTCKLARKLGTICGSVRLPVTRGTGQSTLASAVSPLLCNSLTRPCVLACRYIASLNLLLQCYSRFWCSSWQLSLPYEQSTHMSYWRQLTSLGVSTLLTPASYSSSASAPRAQQRMLGLFRISSGVPPSAHEDPSASRTAWMPFLEVKAMWVYCSIFFKVLSSTCRGGTPFFYEASSPVKLAKRLAILV